MDIPKNGIIPLMVKRKIVVTICRSAAYFGVSILLLAGLWAYKAYADKSVAQGNYETVYAVMATVTVKPEYFSKFVNETIPLINKSRAEEGIIVYQLHQSADNPLQFMWYEHFKDKESFDRHVASDHVSTWAKSLKDMASVQLVAKPFVLIESNSDISMP